jgi:two-component system, chemotaxis family, protein-glutamate methylesterase/glutaminase
MPPSLIVMGTSLGGLGALREILGALPEDFSIPVALVQHRGREPDETLTTLLQISSRLRVCEPEDKEAIMAGRIYVAPADYHLLVECGTFALSTEGRVNHSRPAIDVLFESAAQAYGRGVVGVVLTGASNDGTEGARHIKKQGGLVIVQDPKTAEAPLMPQSAAAVPGVDRVLPVTEIGPYLVALAEARGLGRRAP